MNLFMKMHILLYQGNLLHEQFFFKAVKQFCFKYLYLQNFVNSLWHNAYNTITNFVVMIKKYIF